MSTPFTERLWTINDLLSAAHGKGRDEERTAVCDGFIADTLFFLFNNPCGHHKTHGLIHRHIQGHEILSSQKLHNSSFVDPFPTQTVYKQLPELIEYYLTRWEQLNLISPFYNKEFFDPQHLAEEFLRNPENLLADIHNQKIEPFQSVDDLA
ncbi:MAG: hypothetical protein PF442_07820 [Desulfobulbaceae bacterium]|nr:hypothetical protein [Desulfobulbaceae bacterium]